MVISRKRELSESNETDPPIRYELIRKSARASGLLKCGRIFVSIAARIFLYEANES